MLRSIAAVVAGYLTTVVGVSTFFAILVFTALGGRMPAATLSPPGWLLALEIAVSPVIGVAGGYVCAFIGRRREMVHAFVLVGLMALLGAVTLAVEPKGKPLWSSALVVLLGCAGVLAGAALRRRQARGDAVPALA